jgi:hypothetical protein
MLTTFALGRWLARKFSPYQKRASATCMGNVINDLASAGQRAMSFHFVAHHKNEAIMTHTPTLSRSLRAVCLSSLRIMRAAGRSLQTVNESRVLRLSSHTATKSPRLIHFVCHFLSQQLIKNEMQMLLIFFFNFEHVELMIRG